MLPVILLDIARLLLSKFLRMSSSSLTHSIFLLAKAISFNSKLISLSAIRILGLHLLRIFSTRFIGLSVSIFVYVAPIFKQASIAA